MSRSKTHDRTGNAVNGGGWRRARQAAARLRPAVGRVMPMTKATTAAARRQADRTRAWAAPQVERAGHVVQDSVAPKVSSMLSAAARGIEPEKPRRRRWRKVAGVSAATAAVTAVAAAVRGRMNASAAAAPDDLAQAEGEPSAAGTASVMDTGNGQGRPGSHVGLDSAERTP